MCKGPGATPETGSGKPLENRETRAEMTDSRKQKDEDWQGAKANGLHLEMGRDLLEHCHWPARTQACSDRPRGQAQADWLLPLHPPCPGPGFHCLCWCPVLSCIFYPDGALRAKAVALPRHAALRFCNCSMPWAPSTSSWNLGMADRIDCPTLPRWD